MWQKKGREREKKWYMKISKVTESFARLCSSSFAKRYKLAPLHLQSLLTVSFVRIFPFPLVNVQVDFIYA